SFEPPVKLALGKVPLRERPLDPRTCCPAPHSETELANPGSPPGIAGQSLPEPAAGAIEDTASTASVVRFPGKRCILITLSGQGTAVKPRFWGMELPSRWDFGPVWATIQAVSPLRRRRGTARFGEARARPNRSGGFAIRTISCAACRIANI